MSNLDDATRDARKRAFLEDFARHGVISPAAEKAGVHRRTVARWKEEDEEFAEAFEDAFQSAVDAAEHELRKRGVEGDDELILVKGEPIKVLDPRTGEPVLDDDFNPRYLTRKVKSDRLLEIYTRAHRPIYSEKRSVELTGKDGAPLQPTTVNVNFVDPPDWDEVEWGEDGRPKLPADPLE